MAEIKSFREYIAERALLEANPDDVTDDDDFLAGDDEHQNATIHGTKIKPEENSEEKSESDDAENKSRKASANSENYNPGENVKVVVTDNFNLKLTPNSLPTKKIEELSKKVQFLNNAYRNVAMLATAGEFVTFNGNVDDIGYNSAKDVPLPNITHGKSLRIVYDYYSKLIKSAAEKLQKSNEEVRDVSKTKHGNKDAYRRLTGENGRFKDRISREDNETEANEGQEQPKEEKPNSAAAKLFKKDLPLSPAAKLFKEEEELLNELNFRETMRAKLDSLKNLGRTTSEISGGIGNRYSKRRILNTSKLNGKNQDEQDFVQYQQFLENAFNKYKKDALGIINRERSQGISYLNKGIRLLNSVTKKLRYTKVSDNLYINSILGELNSAYSILKGIGTSLENLVSEFDRSLERLREELSVRAEKNDETMNSINTQTTLRRYEKNRERDEKVKEFTGNIKNAVAGKIKDKVDQIKAERDEKRERIEKDKKSEQKVLALTKKSAKSRFDTLLDSYLKPGNFKPESFVEAYNKAKEQLAKDEYYEKADAAGNSGDDLKKAEAMALLSIVTGKNKLRKFYNRSSALFKDKGFVGRVFDDLFSDVYKAAIDKSTSEILKAAARGLKIKDEEPKASDGERKANEALTDTDRPRATSRFKKFANNAIERLGKASGYPAKDFNGAKPQAANIFDYAVEKAKKLQER